MRTPVLEDKQDDPRRPAPIVSVRPLVEVYRLILRARFAKTEKIDYEISDSIKNGTSPVASQGGGEEQTNDIYSIQRNSQLDTTNYGSTALQALNSNQLKSN